MTVETQHNSVRHGIFRLHPYCTRPRQWSPLRPVPYRLRRRRDRPFDRVTSDSNPLLTLLCRNLHELFHSHSLSVQFPFGIRRTSTMPTLTAGGRMVPWRLSRSKPLTSRCESRTTELCGRGLGSVLRLTLKVGVATDRPTSRGGLDESNSESRRREQRRHRRFSGHGSPPFPRTDSQSVVETLLR